MCTLPIGNVHFKPHQIRNWLLAVFSPNILTRLPTIHQQKYRYYDQQKLLAGQIFQLVLDSPKCWTDFSAGIGQRQMLFLSARNWKFELSHTLADTTVRGVISMYLRNQVQFLYHEVPAGVKGHSSVLIWGK